MSRRRRGKLGMKGKAAAGGVAAIAIGLALYGLFSGFGGGPGLGDGSPGNETANPSDDPDETDDDPKPEETAGPLHVVVEDEGYSIARGKPGKRTYEMVDLETIVTKAADAKPSHDGYRVYITVRPTVTIAAHRELVQKLEAGGLKPAEISGYDDKDVDEEKATES